MYGEQTRLRSIRNSLGGFYSHCTLFTPRRRPLHVCAVKDVGLLLSPFTDSLRLPERWSRPSSRSPYNLRLLPTYLERSTSSVPLSVTSGYLLISNSVLWSPTHQGNLISVRKNSFFLLFYWKERTLVSDYPKHGPSRNNRTTVPRLNRGNKEKTVYP